MGFNSSTARKALAAKGGHATARIMRSVGFPALVKARAVQAAMRLSRRFAIDQANAYIEKGCPNCGYKPQLGTNLDVLGDK